jgi:excisionase family DNA binding protein
LESPGSRIGQDWTGRCAEALGGSAAGPWIWNAHMKRVTGERIGTEWFGLRQVAQYAAVSERTVRGWIHASVDALPAVRVRGKILVRRSELDAWLGRHKVQPLGAIDPDGIVREALQVVAHGR